MGKSKTSRRSFLKHVGLGAAALAVPGTQCRSTPCANPAQSRVGKRGRPNFLFVTTDYQAGEDGPSLGSPFLEMPALDRLCREGVVFARHYSTAPICVPARYTWISGLYPHHHGQWDNGSEWLPEGSHVLMEQLKEAGYSTVGVGKMHFQPWDRMAGFDRRIIADCKGSRWKEDDYAKFIQKHGFKGNRLGNAPGRKTEIPEVYDWPYDEDLHIDAFVGDQARGIIDRGELRPPWFLWVSFNGPHNPWDPPARCSRKYKEMKLPPARTFPNELRTKPMDHTRVRYNYTRNVVDYIDQNPDQREEIIHRIRAGHYGNLTFIDKKLEGILGALEKRGELDSTIVLYSADHGSHLGDHNNIHKGTHYERSARVPFVVRAPERFPPRRVRGFSSHVDLFPTLLSLAGVPVPASAEGKDISPLLTGKTESVQDHVIIEIRGSTSIITDRWKMGIHPRDHQGDLYDRATDPQDLCNLYENSEYEEVRKELTEKLTAFRPALAGQLKRKPPNPFVEEKEYSLKQGDVLAPAKAPDQAGKAVSIFASIEPLGEREPEGIIVSFRHGDVHGYALYIEEGRLAMGVRRWRKDTIVRARAKLPAGKVTVEGLLAKNGAIVLKVEGKEVASGNARGCIPVQPGRRRFFAGWVHVGVSPKTGKPIGEYEKGASFCGVLGNTVLRLEE